MENKEIKQKDYLGIINIVLLVLSVLMTWFVSYRIYSYFSWIYALIFFFIVHLSLVGIFFLTKKKKKLGIAIHIIMSILLFALSVGMLKISSFTNQVFDNSETEVVMLVAKKDSSITKDDDFKGKKIASVLGDEDTNVFAKEMLNEAKKEFEETVYVTHKEAYEALVNGDVDMMVYNSYIKQRLLDEDIDSTDEIKIIMKKSRELQTVESKQVDISKDPFNVYISGVDTSSDDVKDRGNSDVNIIMSVNPQTKRVIMQTIPRDTWAAIACVNGGRTKLTYAGIYGGTECSIKTIERYFGIDINYYAKINFQGVIDLVDALGGITVNSDVAFCDGPSRTTCFNAGENTLNGEEALVFSRIRKVFAEGDVARGRHQMEVINAVIRKFSSSPSIGNINALLGAVENNFTTNLSEGDIGKSLELILKMGDQMKNIEAYTMKGELVWYDDEVRYEYLYYFIPNEGQVDLVKQRIQDIMDGK